MKIDSLWQCVYTCISGKRGDAILMKYRGMTARIIVSALVIVLACIYGYMKLTKQTEYALAVKTPASLGFVILGLMCFSPAPSEKRYCACMLAALVMSLVGDVLLVIKGTAFFVLGMAFFGIAQAFISAALWQKSKPGKATIALFVCLFAGAVAYLLLQPRFVFGSLLPPIIVYALLITFMLSMALTLPASRAGKKRRIAVVCGACLFFISDFILIHIICLPDAPIMAALTLINSLTYFPAQVMLAQSMGLNDAATTDVPSSLRTAEE